MTSRSALFRPDAQAGHGHLSRSLALASAWIDAGGTALVSAPGIDDTWQRRFEEIGASFEERSCDWCVLDGYTNGVDVQRAARAAHGRLLVVDDHGSIGEYDADALLDHNVGAAPVPGSDAVQLTGTRYLLLRHEFAAVGIRTGQPSPRHVLLAPGGTPDDATTRVFGAVAAALAPGTSVTWLRGVDDVVATMAAAGAAVAAAGMTAYELCRVGVPTVLVAVAANQEPVGQRLGSRGAAHYAGRLDECDGASLAAEASGLLDDPDDMSAIAQRVVDGAGPRRVVAAMRSFDIDLRDAGPDDVELIWRWANDPDVRRQSFSVDAIPLEHHRSWFGRRLTDPDAEMFVAELGGRPFGQVRFERSPGAHDWTLGYSIAAGFRGRGLAAPMLVAAVARLRRRHHDAGVEALVNPHNPASAKALDLAGFEPMEPRGAVLRYLLRARS